MNYCKMAMHTERNVSLVVKAPYTGEDTNRSHFRTQMKTDLLQ